MLLVAMSDSVSVRVNASVGVKNLLMRASLQASQLKQMKQGVNVVHGASCCLEDIQAMSMTAKLPGSDGIKVGARFPVGCVDFDKSIDRNSICAIWQNLFQCWTDMLFDIIIATGLMCWTVGY